MRRLAGKQGATARWDGRQAGGMHTSVPRSVCSAGLAPAAARLAAASTQLPTPAAADDSLSGCLLGAPARRQTTAAGPGTLSGLCVRTHVRRLCRQQQRWNARTQHLRAGAQGRRQRFITPTAHMQAHARSTHALEHTHAAGCVCVAGLLKAQRAHLLARHATPTTCRRKWPCRGAVDAWSRAARHAAARSASAVRCRYWCRTPCRAVPLPLPLVASS